MEPPEPPPGLARIGSHGRTFKHMNPNTLAEMSATTSSATPQPPGKQQYSDRMNRARAANRASIISRSPSLEQLPTRVVANSQVSVFERIAAEVGREDCREMVRDVTYAFLPTRSQSQVPEAESAASTEADAREDSALTAMSVQVAIEAGSSDQLSRLLQMRADPNQVLSSGQLPLSAAIVNGSLAATATLLTYGADVGGVDARGMTALHHAALNANTQLIQLLLSSGASASATNGSGLRPAEITSDSAALALFADGDDEVDDDEHADDEHGESSVSPADGTAPAAMHDEEGPPPYPSLPLGEFATAPGTLLPDALRHELQRALGSQESDPKRLLMQGSLKPRSQLCCDVVRTAPSSYRCYLRLNGSSARRICIFEASRARKGKLANAHYRISLPSDARLTGASHSDYCGKVRSFHLSGAVFVVYDDGHKPGVKPSTTERAAGQIHERKQLAAIAFSKGHSRRSPMTMRALLPIPTDSSGCGADASQSTPPLLEVVQALDQHADGSVPGAESLQLSPPLWNEQGQMFQLAFEGRACCMSNKNVQLVSDRCATLPTLQVGKLRKNLFNMDLAGYISPYQAFAVALAIFDQSSVRRRF